MQKGTTPNKIITVIGNILLYTFVILSIISVIVIISGKKDGDGAVTVFGGQMRYVLTNSMEASEHTNTDDYDIKSIPRGSMIFIDVVPEDEKEAYEWYKELEVGDVLTFKYVYTTQQTITHRITKIYDNEDKTGFIIELEGDNKSADGGTLTQKIDTAKRNTVDEEYGNYVVGKVVGQSVFIGKVVSILQNPVGLICVVVLPCVAIIIFEVLKIVGILTRDKKAKEAEEKRQKDEELEMLRRRLEELEASRSEQRTEVNSGDEP